MEYIIGAGAILESGENATITPAALHAQVDPVLAERVQAVAIDFEGTTLHDVRRLLVAGRGLNAAAFRCRVTDQLREQRVCSLAHVLVSLARAASADEVHLFAHWLPDEETAAELQAAGIGIVSHALESIEAASVVAGQRHRLWRAA